MGCDCPLCGARVRGARLCAGCEVDVTRSCREPGARCPRCAQRLRQPAPLCAGCLGRPPAYLRAIVAFDYEPPGVALISQLKTRLRLSLAPVLARLLGAAVARAAPLPADAVLAAVPASRASLRRRGMNPAMEIARSLATALDLPLRHGALLRLRETPRQAGLGRRERRAALAGVFRGQGVRGRHVALVDDVMTTGSTAEAAARALLAAGALSVTVLAVARTPGRGS
jgi:ComF family protein